MDETGAYYTEWSKSERKTIQCINAYIYRIWASLVAQSVKNLPAVQETWVRSLGQEGPLEKEMTTHSSILAWRIPWMEEPGGLQSMRSQRVGHNWVTSLHFTCSSVGKEFSCSIRDLGLIPGLGRSPGEGNDNPLQYPCLENLMDTGDWWAVVHGVAKSRARLSN